MSASMPPTIHTYGCVCLVNAQKYNDFLTNTQQMAILLGVDGDFLAIKYSFISHAVNTKQLVYP